MVVGTNMGCGHGHAHANTAIKQCGISVVIAESFDRNFFKNSINIGLPIIEYPGINKKVKEGNELEVNLHTGQIMNHTTGEILRFTPFPDFLLEILEVGGLEPYVDTLIAQGKI